MPPTGIKTGRGSEGVAASPAAAGRSCRGLPRRLFPGSREEYPPALPQLVAIDDCAMSARHVVKDAALDKRVHNVVRLAGTLDRDMPYDAIFYPRFLK